MLLYRVGIIEHTCIANPVKLYHFWYNLEVIEQCGTFGHLMVQSKISKMFRYTMVIFTCVSITFVKFLKLPNLKAESKKKDIRSKAKTQKEIYANSDQSSTRKQRSKLKFLGF